LSISETSETDESELEEESFKTEEELKEEIPEILNLDQTIEEFKTAKEYKFIYLAYAVNKKSKYFSPYNFRTLPFKSIDRNCFYTLSTEGMMSHIRNEITFTPFTKFVEEYRNYQKIIKVSYYAYVICFKIFIRIHKLYLFV